MLRVGVVHRAPPLRPWQAPDARHGCCIMVKLSQIVHDYNQAGALNTLLALWGFVDETVFLTKAGHVGLVYQLRGVDYEGLSRAERQTLTHQFEAGLRLLDEHCRVYHYLIKRTTEPFTYARSAQPIVHEAIQRRAAYLNERRHHLYDLALYLVLLYEAPTTVRTSSRLKRLLTAPQEALAGWLQTSRVATVLEAELDRAIGALHQKAQAFEVQISDLGTVRLEKAEAFRFFRHLVNYGPAAAAVAATVPN